MLKIQHVCNAIEKKVGNRCSARFSVHRLCVSLHGRPNALRPSYVYARESNDIHERKLQQSVIPLEKINNSFPVGDFFRAKHTAQSQDNRRGINVSK